MWRFRSRGSFVPWHRCYRLLFIFSTLPGPSGGVSMPATGGRPPPEYTRMPRKNPWSCSSNCPMVNRHSQCGTRESLLRALPYRTCCRRLRCRIAQFSGHGRAGLYVKEAPSFIRIGTMSRRSDWKLFRWSRRQVSILGKSAFIEEGAPNGGPTEITKRGGSGR